MTTCKISLIAVTISLCSVVYCTAQSIRIPRAVTRPITRTARIQNSALSVSSPYVRNSAAITHSRSFFRQAKMLDLVTNYRNKHLIKVLSDRLQSFSSTASSNPKGEVTFSGHFVPSKKALNRETHLVVKPELRVSSKQAVEDMLHQATRAKYGYGIIKVFEPAKSAKEEPKMTTLVLDATNLEWMEYPGKKTSESKVEEVSYSK